MIETVSSKFIGRTGILRWLLRETAGDGFIRLSGCLLVSRSDESGARRPDACFNVVMLAVVTRREAECMSRDAGVDPSVYLRQSQTSLPTIWRRNRTKTPRCLFAMLIIDTLAFVRWRAHWLQAVRLPPTSQRARHNDILLSNSAGYC